MKLEEKLVSLRKAKGLSQMKLAEKMNVSRQAISRWETGAAIPSSENLKYLSDLSFPLTCAVRSKQLGLEIRTLVMVTLFSMKHGQKRALMGVIS